MRPRHKAAEIESRGESEKPADWASMRPRHKAAEIYLTSCHSALMLSSFNEAAA